MAPNSTTSTPMNSTNQVIHPGPSKEIWDAALIRSGLDPADVAVYNVTSFNRAADADTAVEQ